jgi:hypothetical protein
MEEEFDQSDTILNESVTSNVDPIPHTHYPPNTSGWVNYRHSNTDEIQNEPFWNLRWLAVEVRGNINIVFYITIILIFDPVLL